MAASPTDRRPLLRALLALWLIGATHCAQESAPTGPAGAGGSAAGSAGSGAGSGGTSSAGASGSGGSAAGAAGQGGAGAGGEAGAAGSAGGSAGASGAAGSGAAGNAGAGGAGAAGAAGGGAVAAGAQPDLAKVRQWVHDVTLGPEFGGAGEICSRWTHPIKLSVMKGGQQERKDLLDLLPILNVELKPAGTPIELVQDADASADMEVYFAKLSEFDAIAQSNGFSYVQGNWGYFYTFWNAGHEMQKAYVLLASDVLTGASLRHFTFEEVTQALGLSSDSPLFADSIFYANGSDGGAASTLSPLDRKLVSFFYTHVKPGDGKAQLDAAFDAHWK